MTRRTVSSLLADARLRLTMGESVASSGSILHSKGEHAFPEFAQGRIHEWYPANCFQGKVWHPPLTLLTRLALSGNATGRILWVGRRCWPTFQHLCAFPSTPETPLARLRRSTFLDPLTDKERFWAIGQGLRCSGVGCVVADGSGMSATVSRRLQLAAESGKAVGLIARPPWELEEPSYAATRWRVQPRDSCTGWPQWKVELLSCRGQPPEQDVPRRWIVDWAYRVLVGTGTLHFSPDVGCKPAQAPGGATSARYKTA